MNPSKVKFLTNEELIELDVLAGDMIDFCQRIILLNQGMELDTFANHYCVFPATLRYIQIMGEIANKVLPEVHEAHPEIEWRDMIRTRHILAHKYKGINPEIMWNIALNIMPNTLPKVKDFKKKINKKTYLK